MCGTHVEHPRTDTLRQKEGKVRIMHVEHPRTDSLRQVDLRGLWSHTVIHTHSAIQSAMRLSNARCINKNLNMLYSLLVSSFHTRLGKFN